MPEFTVIAFYTFDTPYQAECTKLIESCEALGIPIETQGYPNTGSWVRNAALKSIFISAMMARHPKGARLVYVDVDARVRKYPGLFDSLEGDLGVHYRKRKDGRIELLSGTLFIRNNERAHNLVKAWIRHQTANPTMWDQRTLQAVIELKAGDLGVKIQELPATYCQIFDTMRGAGHPVIEHMQASRRYRHMIPETYHAEKEMPETLGRVRVRRGYDGTYYTTRSDRVAEAYLDKACIRVRNERRWIPKVEAEADVSSLKPMFYKQPCYLVGKGPSLDHLRAEHFLKREAPVIAINEAIHAVEQLGLPNPTFCLQQDAKLKDTCWPKHGSKMLVSIKAANFYAGRKGVYIFDSRRYGLSLNSLSVSAAIRIAISLDAESFILVCFDASVNKTLGYAKSIGYSATWGGKPNRFLGHRRKIDRWTGNHPTQWVIPQPLSEPAAPQGSHPLG